MTKGITWIGQAVLYALFAAIIGIFSTFPRYQHLANDEALIRLSFSHSGKLLSACRRRSAEELAKLAPNMRTPLDCQRARSSVTVEIDLDGHTVFHAVAPPSGLSKDGSSTVYHRFPVSAGTHQLAVRLKDDAKSDGFNYRRADSVTLKPGQVLVIDFDAEKGGITLQ